VEQDEEVGQVAVGWGWVKETAKKTAIRSAVNASFLIECDKLYLSMNRKCSIAAINSIDNWKEA
jgi:hypothetical protein